VSADTRRPRSVYSVGEDADPRFSLANERTLLAWLRTALAFVVTGLALAAARRLVEGEWVPAVAAAAVVVGAVLAPWAYLRWSACERALRLRQPLPSPTIALPVVAGVLALAAIAVVELVSQLT
jgi:putative membrane protein